jgi:hypothetical protein
LIEADGTITKVSDDAAETTPWTGAYVATRDLGHIFCPDEISPHVYIAAQVALLEQFGVRVPSSMIHYAKQESAGVDALRGNLEERGWWEGRSRDLRPIPPALTNADATDRIAQIAERLQGYWGPARSDSAGESVGPSGTVGFTQVRSFVRQFADGGNDIVDLALTVLANIRVIGRSDVGRAVADFIEANPQFRGSSCAPLGQGKDSGAVLTYFVGDVADQYDLSIRSVEEAAAFDAPILFIDDFIGTGRQAVDIVQAWLGAERTEDLDEERHALPAGAQGLLRERELGFVFAGGTDAGVENLRSKLGALDLTISAMAGLTGTELPTISSVLGSAAEPFVEFARSKGFELLAVHNGTERDEEWRHARELGFGNSGFIVASAFNTPTASLTLLWSEGQDWRPLLPRRTKR